ncbi:MAG TPA: hypothetical protein VMY78_10890 [Solirubrobacteraceae bacterium]|nr:hypothetical protein [Solirubrobacteraceae bacterium]
MSTTIAIEMKASSRRAPAGEVMAADRSPIIGDARGASRVEVARAMERAAGAA